MVMRSVLDNGIRVVTERVPGVHSAALGVWVENGSRHESAEQNGLSHFLEHMLFKGTEQRSARDIARTIDSVGGLLNAFTAREFSCFYAKVLSHHLPLAIDLLADLLLHSTFDPEELEKERRVILQELSMVEDTPEEWVHDLFCAAFWQGHPLGRPILGSHATVDSFDSATLRAFLAERYTGCNLVVCAAGDVEHARIVALIAAAFQALPAGQPAPPPVPPRSWRDLGLHPRPLEQVHLCLGLGAFPQSHPGRYDAYLLNAILGSSMSSRLFQKVREERGLAYSVYSYLNAFADTGALVIYAGTAPGEVREVVDLALREIRDLRSRPVGPDELAAAREQLKGNLLLSLESTDNRMTRLAKNEIYFGRDLPLAEVLTALDAVTPEQLLASARDMLREEELHLQAVGKLQEREFTTVDLAFTCPD